jgi:hypothetical protein
MSFVLPTLLHPIVSIFVSSVLFSFYLPQYCLDSNGQTRDVRNLETSFEKKSKFWKYWVVVENFTILL